MISAERAQKNRELEIFEHFAEAANCVPAGPRLQPPPPEPDVVVETTSGPLGIELTEVHPSGVEKRRHEGEQAAILRRARELYEADGHPNVQVWVTWASDEARWLREHVAQRLAALVADHVDSEPHPVELGTGFERLEPELPILHISLAKSRSPHRFAWRDDQFHEVHGYWAADVQERLTAKEAKLAGYKARCTSCWLVLVMETENPSTWGVMVEEVSETAFRTDFDRVFIFSLISRAVQELLVGSAVPKPHRRPTS